MKKLQNYECNYNAQILRNLSWNCRNERIKLKLPPNIISKALLNSDQKAILRTALQIKLKRVLLIVGLLLETFYAPIEKNMKFIIMKLNIKSENQILFLWLFLLNFLFLSNYHHTGLLWFYFNNTYLSDED